MSEAQEQEHEQNGTAEPAESASTVPDEVEAVTKQSIRQKIWRHMESNRLVNFPRPCYNRIPNFKGAEEAAELLSKEKVFLDANVVNTNPDAPLQEIRFRALEAGKTLLMPAVQLTHGLFFQADPPAGATNQMLRQMRTAKGFNQHSKAVPLDSGPKCDLVIVGSVAVDKRGLRIGKGKGFADLEWAMMRSLGMADATTPVVTLVSECQLVDIPDELVVDHDLVVDYIITPKEVIATNSSRPKPTGIRWNELTQEQLQTIPILSHIRMREFREGRDCRLAGQETAPTEEELLEQVALAEQAAEQAKKDEENGIAPRRGRRRTSPRRPRSERPPKPESANQGEGEHAAASDNAVAAASGDKRKRGGRRSRRGKPRDAEASAEEGKASPPPAGERGERGERGRGRRRLRGRRGGRTAHEDGGEAAENPEESGSGDRADGEPTDDDERGGREGGRSGRRSRRGNSSRTKPGTTLFVGGIPDSMHPLDFGKMLRSKEIDLHPTVVSYSRHAVWLRFNTTKKERIEGFMEKLRDVKLEQQQPQQQPERPPPEQQPQSNHNNNNSEANGHAPSNAVEFDGKLRVELAKLRFNPRRSPRRRGGPRQSSVSPTGGNEGGEHSGDSAAPEAAAAAAGGAEASSDS